MPADGLYELGRHVLVEAERRAVEAASTRRFAAHTDACYETRGDGSAVVLPFPGSVRGAARGGESSR